MDRHRRGRGQGADNLPPDGIVFVAGLKEAIDTELAILPAGLQA